MRIINTYYEPVDADRKLSEAEIINLCCAKVPVNDCSEVGLVSPYEGADQEHRDFNEDEALAKARADNPSYRILSVKVEGLGPPPGTPCGKKYESWQDRNNCCDGVPALAWRDDVTPDVLPHDSSIIIAWEGGTGGQVELTTSSNGTWFPGGRKTVTGYGSSIELKAGPTFCGATAVTVRDGCSSATIVIRSDLGSWYYLGNVCVLSGTPGPIINGWGELISGKYKQRDHIESVYWQLCIFCMPGCAGNANPVCAAGSPTCEDTFISLLEAARPAGMVMDTCLNFDISKGISNIYGYLSDGAIVYRSSSGCVYTCNCDQIYTGATYYRNAAINRSTDKQAYEWRC